MKEKTSLNFKKLKGLLIPTIIIILWYITSYWKILNPYIIPAPMKILEITTILIKKGILFRHILASFQRVLIGFLTAFLLAFPLAVLVGIYPDINDYINPVLEFVRHIPPIATIPMLILWLGIGEASKIAVIILATFFPIYLNTLNGVVGCDKKLLEVGDIFEFTMTEKFLKIILPSALPSVIVGMRLGLGYSWRALIGAELIAASSGIGYMIMDAEQLSRPDIIIVGIITIGLLGLLIDHISLKVTDEFFHYRKDVDHGKNHN